MKLTEHQEQVLREATALKKIVKVPEWKQSLGAFLHAEKKSVEQEFYSSLKLNNPIEQAKLAGQLHQLEQITLYITGIFERSKGIEDAVTSYQVNQINKDTL